MPHLRFEYSKGLERQADLDALATTLRDALVTTGHCPLGEGRDEATRARITDKLYAAAEAALRGQLGDLAFILSLEVVEIDTRFSRKGWSTIHAAIKERRA